MDAFYQVNGTVIGSEVVEEPPLLPSPIDLVSTLLRRQPPVIRRILGPEELVVLGRNRLLILG